MHYFLSAFLFLLCTITPVYAEKIVQCITNFPINAELYTQTLQARGYGGKVVVTDIKDYESRLLKKQGKWWTRLHLHFLNRISLADNIDKIVFFNITPKMVLKYDLSRLPKEKLVLFMWEPRTVLRRMYLPSIQDCFSQIYTWDDSLVDEKTYFKFHYPVLCPEIDSIPSFEEKKFCTLVASDLKSKDERELYSERRKAIRFFEEIGEEGFEFYGKRWDPAEFKSYRGSTPDKLGTLKNYRFCICYENTQGTPGYVTEKIFDCFAAGTVPVYWGASNIEDYIPKDCFIDRRNFASLDKLYAFLKGMSKQDYENYLLQIHEFLLSSAAKRFTQEALNASFCQAVLK